jgi:hypothetical protein
MYNVSFRQAGSGNRPAYFFEFGGGIGANRADCGFRILQRANNEVRLNQRHPDKVVESVMPMLLRSVGSPVESDNNATLASVYISVRAVSIPGQRLISNRWTSIPLR